MEGVAVDSIAITNEKPRHCIIGNRLDDLLGSPSSGRMGCHVEMDDVPTVMTHHNKGEEYAKGCGRDGEEVDGDDVGQMIVQECPPRLRWRVALPNPILTHGCFGQRVAQQCELGLDARE